jgi:hypothetical protein
MNPLLTALLASSVRWIITAAATYGVTVSNDQATQIVSGLAGAASLAWSLYHKAKVDAKIKAVEAEKP